MDGFHEFHDHPLTFFIWKNADEGIKEGSKKEKVLRLLLQHSSIDVLLVKNKDGYSVYDYLLQKDHLNVNSGKKKLRTHLIRVIGKCKLRMKYFFMIMKSKSLAKLKPNLKVLVARNLA